MITSLQNFRYVTGISLDHCTYYFREGFLSYLSLRKKEKNTLGTLKNYSDVTTEQVASLLSIVSG